MNSGPEASNTARSELSAHERLFAIAAAANAAHDADEILLMIRNAMLEVGGFDRVGVWLIEDNVLYGTWGTDEAGNIRDEHGIIYHLCDLTLDHHKVWEENALYSIGTGTVVHVPGQGLQPIPEPHYFCAIGLRARGELIGVIFADNLLSNMPIYDADLQALLPFTEWLAVAVANARLLAERERHLEQQRRLTSISTAINARIPLSEILLMVRNAVAEACGVDRAAIFVLDREAQLLRGAWGTNREGQTENISHQAIDINDSSEFFGVNVALGEAEYSLLEDFTAFCNLSPQSEMYGVRAHAIVPLRAGRETLGVLCVDNLLRDAPITLRDLEALRPFAEQAAVAIESDRLFTQLRHTQEALVRSERLSAVGELAAGVAHNINNILTAVLGYAELIRYEVAETSPIQEYARIIALSAMDGAEIAHRVKQFASRKTDEGKENFDLTAAVRDAIDLTRPIWRHRAQEQGVSIDLVTELTPDLPLWGVESEIREVVTNLIKNAVDAMMPAGGTLTVRSFASGGQAGVEVSDTGIGMDEATRQRVFEPFFTTKGPALGSGLGLSVSWGIVERHCGNIQVRSQPGTGTTFCVELPLAPPPTPEPPAIHIQP